MTTFALTGIDYAIIAVVIAFTAFGAVKGALAFIVIAFSVLSTFLLFPLAHAALIAHASWYANTPVFRVALYLVLFIVSAIVFRLLANLINSFFKALLIGFVDRILGAALLFVISVFGIYFVARIVSILLNRPIDSFGSNALIVIETIVKTFVPF